MTTDWMNRKICNAVLWLFAGLVIVIVLTSCSPYQGANLHLETPTPAQPVSSVTASPQIANLQFETPTPRPITCTVTAYTLNFRSGPGTQHAVKDVLHNGERVQIISGGDWLKVETAQRVTGWAYGKYINCLRIGGR